MRARQAQGFGGIAVALALAGTSRPSGAVPTEGDREPLSVRYSTPPGCSSEGAFLGELFSRTDRARPAGPGESARTFDVTIRMGPGGVVGELVTTDEGGASQRRAVSGADCAEVSSALALILALTVDPAARTGPPAASAPTAPVGAFPSAPVSSPPPPAPAAAPQPAIVPPPAGPAETVAEAAFVPLWSLGAELRGAAGLVPGVILGGGAHVGLEDASQKIVSPSIRLGAHGAFVTTALEGNVGAEILWIVLRLEGCPLRPRPAPSVRLDACVTFDGGVMQTRGTGLDRPSVSLKPWFAGGGLARAEWLHSSGLRLDLSAGLELPFRRYPFEFGPGEGDAIREAFRIGALGGAVTLGVGTELP